MIVSIFYRADMVGNWFYQNSFKKNAAERNEYTHENYVSIMCSKTREKWRNNLNQRYQ